LGVLSVQVVRKGLRPLLGVAGVAVALLLPVPAGAVEWCTPETTQQAYDALLVAADDGSTLDADARRVADEATAQGTFASDATLFRLDDLAWDAGFAFDCDRGIYVYAPDVTNGDVPTDEAGDDGAGEVPGDDDAGGDAESYEDGDAGLEDEEDAGGGPEDEAADPETPSRPGPATKAPTGRPTAAPAKATAPAPAPAPAAPPASTGPATVPAATPDGTPAATAAAAGAAPPVSPPETASPLSTPVADPPLVMAAAPAASAPVPGEDGVPPQPASASRPLPAATAPGPGPWPLVAGAAAAVAVATAFLRRRGRR
jgi:hypothetical protein